MPIAPPCSDSANGRRALRTRQPNARAAIAAAAMPLRRSSIGTRSQPWSAAYLSRAATPANSTSMPILTGTLPSLNQRRIVLPARSNQSGSLLRTAGAATVVATVAGTGSGGAAGRAARGGSGGSGGSGGGGAMMVGVSLVAAGGAGAIAGVAPGAGAGGVAAAAGSGMGAVAASAPARSRLAVVLRSVCNSRCSASKRWRSAPSRT